MNRSILLAVMLLSVVCGSIVFAHGDKRHVMGIVGKLDVESVVVTTGEGEPVSIRLSKETKYQKGETPASADDLKVGDRVVIDLDGEGDSAFAAEIRFSTGSASQQVQERHPQAGAAGPHDH